MKVSLQVIELGFNMDDEFQPRLMGSSHEKEGENGHKKKMGKETDRRVSTKK